MLVAFIDFTKAYDKMNWEKLWSCLQRVGVKGRCLRFIQALYEGSVCRVKVEGQVSGDFEVNSGLGQGCVLSPLLFSLYINGVVKRLKEEDVEWNVVVTSFLVCCLQMTLGSLRGIGVEEFGCTGGVV